MNRRSEGGSVRYLALTGLFIAAGIVLPMGFHAVGAGKAFLPMHIPVILSGIYLDWPYGLIVGALTPLLSGVMTGMPPFPMAFTMMAELPIYAVVSNLAYHRLRLGSFGAVFAAASAGRIAYGMAAALLFPVLGLPKVPLFYPVTGGLLSGLPGVALQLVMIPLIVARLKPD